MKLVLRIVFLASVLFGILFLAGCALNPSQAIQNLLPIIAGILPIATGLASLLLPGEQDAISAAVTIATAAVKTLLSEVQAYEANPSDTTLAKVTAAFQAAETNIATLEQAVAVKNPLAQKKLAGIVSSLLSALQLVEADIQGLHASKVAAAQAN
jgi:hypothetical protein